MARISACTQNHFCHHVEDLSGSVLTAQTSHGFKEQGFPRRWKNVSSQAVKRQKHVHCVDKQPGGSLCSSRSSTSEKTLKALLKARFAPRHSDPTSCVLAMARFSLFGFCSTLVLLLLLLLCHATWASKCISRHTFNVNVEEFGKHVEVRRIDADTTQRWMLPCRHSTCLSLEQQPDGCFVLGFITIIPSSLSPHNDGRCHPSARL